MARKYRGKFCEVETNMSNAEILREISKVALGELKVINDLFNITGQVDEDTELEKILGYADTLELITRDISKDIIKMLQCLQVLNGVRTEVIHNA